MLPKPTFVNLGTEEEPFWQRSSMNCVGCGRYCSTRTCNYCLEWWFNEEAKLTDKQFLGNKKPFFLTEPSTALSKWGFVKKVKF